MREMVRRMTTPLQLDQQSALDGIPIFWMNNCNFVSAMQKIRISIRTALPTL
jgi:hypothetical protein